MLGLFGDNFAFWRVWDAMRGLDYLLSRPEADSSRVGVTGNSGGGTLSTYLWALDDRLTMAAPGCYITSFHRNFDNELPVDAEQAVPGIAAAGIEMADFLIARRRRPAWSSGRGNDFFDPRGTKEAGLPRPGESTNCSAGAIIWRFTSSRATTATVPATGGRCTGFSWMRPESRGRSKSCRPDRSFSLRRTGRSTGFRAAVPCRNFSPHGAASRSGMPMPFRRS